MLNVRLGETHFTPIHPCCCHGSAERIKPHWPRCKYRRSQIAHHLCILTAPGPGRSPKHRTLSRWAKKRGFSLFNRRAAQRQKMAQPRLHNSRYRFGSLRDTSTTQDWEQLTSFSGSGRDLVKRKSRLVIDASGWALFSSPLFWCSLTTFSKLRVNNYKADANQSNLTFLIAKAPNTHPAKLWQMYLRTLQGAARKAPSGLKPLFYIKRHF